MKRILIINGRYLPGYKDGGPVRSIKNLIDYLGTEYEFYVMAADRDHGDQEPYADIQVHEWNQVGLAKVYYVPPNGFSRNTIEKVSKGMDLIYVCGCFTNYAINTLYLKKHGKIRVPVVVASMGLFSPKEFAHKKWKKKIFVDLFRLFGFFQKIYWSVTSEMEIKELQEATRLKSAKCIIAEDLPRMVMDREIKKEKEEGRLDVVWISRIAHKKNLLFAIQILQSVKADINFTIYGSVHDEFYWEECQKELIKLPENIHYQYQGNVESEEVVATLKKHHVFLFPTLGENYGHVIQEALSAGCPCILSDQTPWRDLEQAQVGYVFELEEKEKYIEVIEKYASMNELEFNSCVLKALQYAIRNSNQKVQNTGYRRIFELE